MSEQKNEPKREIGILGVLGVLIGGGCLVVALVGVVNTAFDLDLALSAYGTSTPIPDSWDAVVGLAAVGALIVGLSLFGSLVARKFAAAKGRPLVRIGIVLGALALLAAVGRGLQILALVSTYGSMLAYYATDGDLEDVKAELARGPSAKDLDDAVSRAAQYDNEAALALLLEAGADLRDSTSPEAQRRCALLGRSYEFIKTALDHGVTVDACPGGALAVREAVSFGESDAEVAKIVELLRSAGWPIDQVPDYDKTPPIELARRKGFSATVTALGG